MQDKCVIHNLMTYSRPAPKLNVNKFCIHLFSGHLVVDLCCYEDADIYDYLDYDARLSEDFVEKVKVVASNNSVRRYVLPLELDEKVDVLTAYITHHCNSTYVVSTYGNSCPRL